MKKYKSLVIETGLYMLLGGFIFGLTMSSNPIKMSLFWEIVLNSISIIFVLGLILLVYFKIKEAEGIEVRTEYFKWTEAADFAQQQNPQISDRMKNILISEARKTFTSEAQQNLEILIEDLEEEERAKYILKVWKDLVPSFQEEKDESQE